MPLGATLRAAYAMPLRRPGAALRAFWPPVLLFVAAWVQALLLPPFVLRPGDPLFFAVLVALLYMLLLTARGATAWHRMLILGDRVPWTPPWPDPRGLRYALWTLGLTLLIVLLYWGFFLYVAPPLLRAAGPIPGIISLKGLSYLLWIASIAVLASPILRLPATSVDRRSGSVPLGLNVRALLLLTTVPAMLASDLLPVLVWSIAITPGFLLGANILATLLDAYAGLVGLTGLSLAFVAAAPFILDEMPDSDTPPG